MADAKDNHREKFIIDDDYLEEDVSGLDSQPYHDHASTVFKNKPFIPFVIGGLGLVVLIIVVTRLFATPQNTVDAEYIQSLESKINKLENQLITRTDLDQALERIDRQESQLNLVKKQLNRFESAVMTQIDQITKEIGGLHRNNKRRPVASAPKPTKSAKKQRIEPSTSKSTTKIHVVQSGDTLYRIGRRYGLTVNQLRSYNELAANTTIYPGQRLKLGPKVKQ